MLFAPSALSTISTAWASGSQLADEAAAEGESFAELLTAASAAQLAAGKACVAATGSAVQELSGASPADAIKSDFRNWMADYLHRGISDDRRRDVQANAAAFEALIDKAVANGGYDNPQAFVESLSTDELAVLQKTHGLAAAIDPAGLSEEGALNLLRSPGSPLDIDFDGFEMVGLAKTWRFPPPGAPESVKQAWKDATAHMSESEVMLLEGSFLPLVIDGVTSTSAYISPDADYRDIVQRAIDQAEFSNRYDEPWQQENRDRQLTVLRSLLDKLPGNSAPTGAAV